MAFNREPRDHVATQLESDREYVTNYGHDHPEKAWILSPRDVLYPNPAYRGSPVAHPEFDEYEADPLQAADARLAAEDDAKMPPPMGEGDALF